MAKRTKRLACFSLCGLILYINFLTVKAEALPEVMSGSSTLADNIMTYYALSGSAVANSDWINTLYSSYGSSFGTIEDLAQQGYLVLNDAGFWEPVQELEQMIEQAPAYSSLGLNEIFNISAEEAAAGGGFAASSGGSILAGSLGGVASTGVIPLLGGVTAAYWGGIALGTLIAHLTGLYGKSVYSGTEMTQSDFLNNVVRDGDTSVCYGNSEYTDAYVGIGRCVAIGYPITTGLVSYDIISQYNDYNGILTAYKHNNLSSTPSSTYNASYINGVAHITSVTLNYGANSSYFIYPKIEFSNSTDKNNYINALRNGQKLNIQSPDIIGENGNQTGGYDPNTGKYTVPDMKPQIDPGTQAGKPLTLPDWLAFANAVQNNNNNVNPTPDGNQGLFQDILDLIRTVIPENVPNPNPNPNPDPYSPPVVTPVPDPSYPDPVPDQQITENPQESENPQQTENPIDTGKPWRLPDLRNKFPFCIPWDIAKVFSKLKVNARQAPHISWRFNPPNTPIDYTFNLDLEDFEEAAALLRTLELLGFIVGLAFATRYLIGAN